MLLKLLKFSIKFFGVSLTVSIVFASFLVANEKLDQNGCLWNVLVLIFFTFTICIYVILALSTAINLPSF